MSDFHNFGDKYSFRDFTLSADGVFDGIITHIADLMIYATENGAIELWQYLEKESGKYNHPDFVLELIKKGCGLMMNAYEDKNFYFILDYEFSNIARQRPEMTDIEFLQLSATKQMLIYFRNFQYEEFHSFSAEFKSSEYQYSIEFLRLAGAYIE